MIAVNIVPGPSFRAGTPKVLFEGRYGFGYDVSPDGKRFLILQSADTEDPTNQAHMIFEWFEEINRRVPAGK